MTPGIEYDFAERELRARLCTLMATTRRHRDGAATSDDVAVDAVAWMRAVDRAVELLEHAAINRPEDLQ